MKNIDDEFIMFVVGMSVFAVWFFAVMVLFQ